MALINNLCGFAAALALVYSSGAMAVSLQDALKDAKSVRGVEAIETDGSQMFPKNRGNTGSAGAAANGYERNIMRESFMKNWDSEPRWNSDAYLITYKHKTAEKAVYMKLAREEPGETTAKAVAERYMKIYGVDASSMKTVSDELVTFEVPLGEKKNTGNKIADKVSSAMKVFVNKSSDAESPYIVIYALGLVDHDDIGYISEDFFLQIQKIQNGQIVPKSVQPGSEAPAALESSKKSDSSDSAK